MKTKPYIIYCAENKTELEEIQIDLFSKGYKWIDGPEIDINFVYLFPKPFPIYISNLPYIKEDDDNDILERRVRYNEFNNDVLFVSHVKSEFKLKLLRKDKLLELYKHENK